eukprot:7555583-Alexandrium_andersonii.AAC.1
MSTCEGVQRLGIASGVSLCYLPVCIPAAPMARMAPKREHARAPPAWRGAIGEGRRRRARSR